MTSYLLFCVVIALQLGLLAQATDLLGGHLGLVGVSAILFAALAAYCYALLTADFGFGPWMSVLVTIPVMAVFGFLIGALLIRLPGNSFLLGTLAFQLGFMQMANNLPALGGALGLRDLPSTASPIPPPPMTDGIVWNALLLLLPAAFITTWLLQRAEGEQYRFGRALHWIRDDSISARMFGFAPDRWRLMAFVLHSVIAAAAGISIAVVQGYISPNSFDLQISIEVLTVLYLAGTGGSPAAMYVGAGLVVALQELLRSFGSVPELVGPIQLIAINLALVAVLCFWRRGLFGPAIESGPSARRLE